jgi:hypothetical protein
MELDDESESLILFFYWLPLLSSCLLSRLLPTLQCLLFNLFHLSFALMNKTSHL